jgi:hypothetical protein
VIATSVGIAVVGIFVLGDRSGQTITVGERALMTLVLGAVYGVPLGLAGGFVALLTLRYLPRLRPTYWPGWGAAVGALIGLAGPVVLNGGRHVDPFLALLFGVPGSLTGLLTGFALKAQLGAASDVAPD